MRAPRTFTISTLSAEYMPVYRMAKSFQNQRVILDFGGLKNAQQLGQTRPGPLPYLIRKKKHLEKSLLETNTSAWSPGAKNTRGLCSYTCISLAKKTYQQTNCSLTAKSPKIPSHVPNQNPASESLVLPKAETRSMEI